MKRRVGIWLVIVLGLILVLAACGEKSQESIVAELDKKLSSMDGYKAKAEMNMKTGQEDQKYDIDIWHKKKDFYRVTLASDQDEKGSQVILKNEDGVFVLTPALKKSFKFQTDWPQNSSQPYLFESLVNDVKKDTEAVFTATDTHFIFQTKTNYQSNNNLPFQEIHFDKKNLTPVLVKVLDKDKTALVEVTFSSFDINPSFQENDFKVDENMAAGAMDADVPVSGAETNNSFVVAFPLYMAGAEFTDKKEVTLDNGQRVIMTFEGEKNFTLIQEKFDVIPVLASPIEVSGEIVNLGFTIGALSNKKIEWSHNGVDFYLASEDLTKEELIEVAQSVQGREVK